MVHKSYTLNLCLEEWFINLLMHAYQYQILLRLFHHFSFHSCCSYCILVYFVAFRILVYFVSFRILAYFVSLRFVSHFSIFSLRNISFRFVSFRSLRFDFVS
jgi:hypothetical protein